MPAAGIDLTKIHPQSIKVVSTPEVDAGPKSIDLTQVDSGRVKLVSMPEPAPAEPSIGARVADAVGNAAKEVASVVANGDVAPGAAAPSIGSHIPIIGPLGQQLGQRFRAGVNYAADRFGNPEPYAQELQEVRSADDAEARKFAEEHPLADYARKIVGGAGALAIPVPGAGGGGAAGAAARVGGALTAAGTDALLRTEDLDKVKQAATLAGGLQAGLEAIPVVGRVAAPLARTAGNAIGAAGAKVGPLLAKVFGGVEPETVAAYAAAPERINAVGALPEDAVKDAIDQQVAQVVGDKSALTDRASQLEGVINDAYKAKQTELLGSGTPLAKAKEMSASLEAQKTALHSLSKEADEALAKSGMTFKKSDLLGAIDGIGKGAGDAIGDEATSALARLQSTRDRIATQLPEEIPATRLRAALQQIRKDINFDQGSGEFNDSLNGMRKAFTGKISDALKDSVPEYADKMAEMSDLADNLTTMNKYFGNETKALGALETLRKGGAKAQIIEDALKNHADVTGDQALAQHLEQLRQNQDLLSRIADGEDLRPALFPRAWNALQEAQAEAQMGSDVASPIERLGQNRTQAVIRNQGGKIPNVMDRRALSALSQTADQDFNQLIRDKNVSDAFKKGAGQGARNAAIGAALGGAVGHYVGAPYQGAAFGAAAGGALDKYAPAMTKGIIDTGIAAGRIPAAIYPYVSPLLESASSGNLTLPATEALLPAPIALPVAKNKDKKDAITRRLGE